MPRSSDEVQIQTHQSAFPVSLLCAVLDVSRSGYYDWLHHKPGKRAVANQELDVKIQAIYHHNKRRYGAPRITKLINEPCSHTRVARRMKYLGLKALGKKTFKVTTDSDPAQPVFPHVLNRDFSTTTINQKWVSDITSIRTAEGWLYLAVFIDLHVL